MKDAEGTKQSKPLGLGRKELEDMFPGFKSSQSLYVELNSGHQGGKQASLPTKLSCCPGRLALDKGALVIRCKMDSFSNVWLEPIGYP